MKSYSLHVSLRKCFWLLASPITYLPRLFNKKVTQSMIAISYILYVFYKLSFYNWLYKCDGNKHYCNVKKVNYLVFSFFLVLINKMHHILVMHVSVGQLGFRRPLIWLHGIALKNVKTTSKKSIWEWFTIFHFW